MFTVLRRLQEAKRGFENCFGNNRLKLCHKLRNVSQRASYSDLFIVNSKQIYRPIQRY